MYTATQAQGSAVTDTDSGRLIGTTCLGAEWLTGGQLLVWAMPGLKRWAASGTCAVVRLLRALVRFLVRGSARVTD